MRRKNSAHRKFLQRRKQSPNSSNKLPLKILSSLHSQSHSQAGPSDKVAAASWVIKSGIMFASFFTTLAQSSTDTVSPTLTPPSTTESVSTSSPTLTPTPVSTQIHTASPTLTPVPTPTPTPTFSPTQSPTVFFTPTPTLTHLLVAPAASAPVAAIVSPIVIVLGLAVMCAGYKFYKNNQKNKSGAGEGNVCVRYWQSKEPDGLAHLSLETDEHYCSFSPVFEDKKGDAPLDPSKVYMGKFEKKEESFFGFSKPTKEIILNLDMSKINKAMDVLIAKNLKWKIWNSPYQESCFNSTTIVLSLLKLGGLNQLLDQRRTFQSLDCKGTAQALFNLEMTATLAGFNHFSSMANEDITPEVVLTILNKAGVVNSCCGNRFTVFSNSRQPSADSHVVQSRVYEL